MAKKTLTVPAGKPGKQISQEAQEDPQFQAKLAEKAAAEKAAAERKAAREKEQTDKEAAQKKAAKELAPAAKEINTFLELATKNEAKADDQRLAAALKLAEVEKAIKAVPGMSFKKWVEENVKLSFETVRKLVAVGSSGDEGKARIALEDMRAKNAAANKKARTKAKAEKQSRSTTNIGSKQVSVAAPKAMSPFKQADTALAALPEDQAIELVKGRAHKLGLAVVSEADAKAIRSAGKGHDAVNAMFDQLSLDSKMRVIDHIERKMNGKFETKL
jgi:hypothetical protein